MMRERMTHNTRVTRECGLHEEMLKRTGQLVRKIKQWSLTTIL